MTASEPHNFIRAIIDQDLASNKHGGRVVTRFPPEPNGYLHIGHAKSVCLNFGLARDIPGGVCHLRFDDTNPLKEDTEYVEAIQEDVRWLGFEWGDRMFFASDYFERLYQFAEELILAGKAYVCSLSEDEVKRQRGSITEPGTPSPDRDRPIDDNLALFRRMRAGEFEDGKLVLRAKIDMSAANMKMRDPAIYRIRHTHHHRTGDQWCIYPLYDFTHGLSDALEHITHSLCTLEFENNRELYDWFLAALDVPSHPQQIEFARLALTYTVVGKRKLRELIEEGFVSGWDDPRMPTLRGLRRRGYTPSAIRSFIERVGVARANSTVDLSSLEHSIREDLNEVAPRVLCVLRPLEVVIENYPEGHVEAIDAPYFPEDVGREGSRTLHFSRTLYIDREDFEEVPPPGYHRLAPGREVRLRHAYVIRCERVEKDASGVVTRLVCSYDPSSRQGKASDGRRIKGTIQWLNREHAVPATVQLYDRLFAVENPERGDGPDFRTTINPTSLVNVQGALVEPSVLEDDVATRYQFERLGFFWRDPVDSKESQLVFNRIVPLKDSWVKAVQSTQSGRSEESARQENRRIERERFKQQQAENAKQRSIELDERGRRYHEHQGLPVEQAHLLSTHPILGEWFEALLERHANARSVANWVVTELAREAKTREPEAWPFTRDQLASLIAAQDSGRIAAPAAKQVFAEMASDGGDPEAIIARRGLSRLEDTNSLLQLIDEVLGAFPDKVTAYRAGNLNLMGLFVGQVMKRSEGRADPKRIAELLTDRLSQ